MRKIKLAPPAAHERGPSLRERLELRAKSHLMQRTRNHGITVPRFWDLFAEQGHRCANICCGAALTGDRFTLIDHCHTTGFTRRLLCPACNSNLGDFREDPNEMRAFAGRMLAKPNLSKRDRARVQRALGLIGYVAQMSEEIEEYELVGGYHAFRDVSPDDLKLGGLLAGMPLGDAAAEEVQAA
jgi:Recombination endonuclease VII